MEDQRVMVIQDASKQVCSSAIKWALHTLILKPGDLLLLLGVLHQVNHPTPVVSLKGTRKLVGYRKKMGFSSKFAANHTIVDREKGRRSLRIMLKFWRFQSFAKHKRIEVTSGAPPAVVAMQSAQNVKATWVILDRKMKKNKKIFLEKLPCGILRMKKNNGIKLLRGPRTKFCLTYDDMLPGNPEEDDLFSIEVFPTSKNNIFFQEPLKFKSEIDELIRVRHKNVVMLLGDCPKGTHRLLVYEYVCNDSLDQHLSSNDNHMKKKTILVQAAECGCQFARVATHENTNVSVSQAAHHYQLMRIEPNTAKIEWQTGSPVWENIVSDKINVGVPIGTSITEPAEAGSLQNLFSSSDVDVGGEGIRKQDIRNKHEMSFGTAYDLSLRLGLFSDPYA
ncbi:hypothetical protein GOBAR_DD33330 [Gossypium barbadense]|nr:hypothetical protein GOBAR_DD33330 [Gossypium barbadense]